MAPIDPLLAAELVVVLLVVATMNSTPCREKKMQPPREEPAAPGGWSAETDLHAQRILRLERRRVDAAAAPLSKGGSHDAA